MVCRISKKQNSVAFRNRINQNKMGSSSSKFKKYLQHGDEYAAMQVYQSSPELRRDLDPNCRHGVE